MVLQFIWTMGSFGSADCVVGEEYLDRVCVEDLKVARRCSGPLLFCSRVAMGPLLLAVEGTLFGASATIFGGPVSVRGRFGSPLDSVALLSSLLSSCFLFCDANVEDFRRIIAP